MDDIQTDDYSFLVTTGELAAKIVCFYLGSSIEFLLLCDLITCRACNKIKNNTDQIHITQYAIIFPLLSFVIRYQVFIIISQKLIIIKRFIVASLIIYSLNSSQSMQSEQSATKQTHNLFLHRFIDNQQAQSVSLMKLDTHSTPYYNKIQNKYITNLVIAGRNYVELYAIFQNQFTLYIGTWNLYQDVMQVQQWEKNIVITANNKIIGLVYEDYMLKNSFMLSLDFLQLGYREPIQTICDKNGYYMLIITAREILLCISQKAVHRYKAKPFSHRKMSIIEQNIKWNRPEYQHIVDVVKFQLYDFELSKVQNFHFCDHFIYFIGYTIRTTSSNTGLTGISQINPQNTSVNQKFLYEIPIEQIFSDNQKQSLIIKLMKLDEQIKQIYTIKRENQTQFLQIRRDNSIFLKNHKGQFMIQRNICKSIPYNEVNSKKEQQFSQDRIICRRNANSLLFPLQIYFRNTLIIYQRSPTSGLSIPAYFSKRIIKIPRNIQIQACDIQENLLVYCNLYEVGIIHFKNLGNTVALGSNLQSIMTNQGELSQILKSRVVLKQSFGNIIDFNIGQNIIIIENTYKKKCSVKLLKKGIIQSQKTHVGHPKKRALQQIQQIKLVRSLEDLLSQYQLTQSEEQITRVKQFLRSYLIIQNRNDQYNFYKLEGNAYQLLFSNFIYWTLVKSYYRTQNQMVENQKLLENCWYLIFLTTQKQLVFYKLPQFLTNINQSVNLTQSILKLSHKVDNIMLQKNKEGTKSKIVRIKQFIISLNEQDCSITLYNWTNQSLLNVNVYKQGEEKRKLTSMRVNCKNITFKRKDKEFLFLEVIAVQDSERLKIWEISAYEGVCQIRHITQNFGQGLSILLRSDQGLHQSHQLRAITCPQYIISDKNFSNQYFKSARILKLHVYEYQTESYLFLINSSEQLQMYKKIYCSSTIANTNLFGNVQTGYLYYRQPLQLNIVKKFKYNENTAFVDIGCGILKVCNIIFFKGELLEFPQNIRGCFRLQGQQIWCITNQNKIKQLISEGKIISHFLTIPIQSQIKQQILGIQSTSQSYIIYSRNSFQVFDKQLKSTWKPSQQQPNINIRNENKQFIIAICAYEHFVAVSYYNYCEVQSKEEYQSIKFKLRIYNIITKKKVIEKQNAFEEPVLHIRFVPPDKLIIVTSSNVSINTIKNQGLQNTRNKHYSKRGMLSGFSYHPEKVGNEPGYMCMIFGGLYGGLNFYGGYWIQKEKLDQIWFQNLKCGIRQLQIFQYGGPKQTLKALIADNSQNIIILDLRPKDADKIADFHIGSPINSIKKRGQLPYFASQDGCIRILFPIKLKDPEINFLDFQQYICRNIPMLGGFNNRDSRLLDQRQRTYKIVSQGNIVDGQLIRNFLSLTETLKNNIYQNTDMTFEELKSQLLGLL